MERETLNASNDIQNSPVRHADWLRIDVFAPELNPPECPAFTLLGPPPGLLCWFFAGSLIASYPGLLTALTAAICCIVWTMLTLRLTADKVLAWKGPIDRHTVIHCILSHYRNYFASTSEFYLQSTDIGVILPSSSPLHSPERDCEPTFELGPQDDLSPRRTVRIFSHNRPLSRYHLLL